MKNKNIIKIGLIVFTLVLVLLPILSTAKFGQGGDWGSGGSGGGGGASTTTCSTAYATAGGLEGIFNYFTCILERLVVPLLFALAFVVFIWGVMQFIMNSADETKRTQGKQFMIWGLIGLVVMFSVWGLVLILRRTIVPNSSNTLFIPGLPEQP